MSSNTGDLYSNYLRSDDRSRQELRNIISKILKNAVDTTEALTESHKLLNSPEYQNLRPTMRLNDRLQTWYRDFETENLNHRRNISRLMGGLRSVVGGLPQSQKLYNDIGNINQKFLNENKFKQGFDNLRDPNKLRDALKIAESGPSAVPQRRGSLSNFNNTPIRRRSLSRQHDSRGRVIRNPSLKRLHTPTTPANNLINVNPQAGPKYYRIDENGNRIQIDGPITPGGITTPLRRESLSPINRRSSLDRRPLAPIQSLSNVSPMSRNASLNHLHPTLLQPSRSVQMLPQVGIPEKRVYFNDPRTGAKMVRVTTPRGKNLLRIEPAETRNRNAAILSRSPTGVVLGSTPPTNPQLKPQTRRMLDDAKTDFSNPVIEDFEVSDCKKNIFKRNRSL